MDRLPIDMYHESANKIAGSLAKDWCHKIHRDKTLHNPHLGAYSCLQGTSSIPIEKGQYISRNLFNTGDIVFPPILDLDESKLFQGRHPDTFLFLNDNYLQACTSSNLSNQVHHT